MLTTTSLQAVMLGLATQLAFVRTCQRTRNRHWDRKATSLRVKATSGEALGREGRLN